MPIDDYEGNTVVAFLDICGFKVLMRDERRALLALDQRERLGRHAAGRKIRRADGSANGASYRRLHSRDSVCVYIGG